MKRALIERSLPLGHCRLGSVHATMPTTQAARSNENQFVVVRDRQDGLDKTAARRKQLHPPDRDGV
jgi:hypothetical protein